MYTTGLFVIGIIVGICIGNPKIRQSIGCFIAKKMNKDKDITKS